MWSSIVFENEHTVCKIGLFVGSSQLAGLLIHHLTGKTIYSPNGMNIINKRWYHNTYTKSQGYVFLRYIHSAVLKDIYKFSTLGQKRTTSCVLVPGMLYWILGVLRSIIPFGDKSSNESRIPRLPRHDDDPPKKLIDGVDFCWLKTCQSASKNQPH